jgi:hypothetical protein
LLADFLSSGTGIPEGSSGPDGVECPA